MSDTAHASPATSRSRLLWVVAAGLLVTAAGYLAFRVFAADVKPDPLAWGLPAFSVLAGVAAFFSPCSFPLLPGYVSHVASDVEPGRTRLAVWPALGVAGFTLLLGAGVWLAGTAVAAGFSMRSGDPGPVVLGLRAVVGVALVGLGAYAIFGRTIRTGLLDSLSRPIGIDETPRPARRLTLYGFGYVAAGLGCSGPILAGLVIFALTVGTPATALVAFAVFGAVLTLLMYAVTRMALGGDDRLDGLRSASPTVKAAVGAVQAAIGVFVLVTVAYPRLFTRLAFPG